MSEEKEDSSQAIMSGEVHVSPQQEKRAISDNVVVNVVVVVLLLLLIATLPIIRRTALRLPRLLLKKRLLCWSVVTNCFWCCCLNQYPVCLFFRLVFSHYVGFLLFEFVCLLACLFALTLDTRTLFVVCLFSIIS